MIEPNIDQLLRRFAFGNCSVDEIHYVEKLISNDPLLRSKLERFQILFNQDSREILIYELSNVNSFNFDELALKIFRYQCKFNPIYKSFISKLKIDTNNIKRIEQIPFLPIELFKSNDIKTGEWEKEIIFLSSGTTNSQRSKHYIYSLDFYHKHSWKIFEEKILSHINTSKDKIRLIALLPSYVDNPQSSLIYMLNGFKKSIGRNESVIIENNFENIISYIKEFVEQEFHVILFGVSFALMDLSKNFCFDSYRLSVIETGGMKTDRRAFLKDEIIDQLHRAFPSSEIISEYGMTELLSQAYAMDGKNYREPFSMKVLISALDDPFLFNKANKRGRINIIDLANIDTCCFIQTADAGIKNEDGSFQVLGRIEEEELRGCNLMYE